MADDVSIRLKLIGAGLFKKDADGASRAIGGVGDSARRAGRSARQAEGSFSRARGQMRQFGQSSLGAQAGVAGVGAGLGAFTKIGVGFNASMESNTVAFTNFLGSTEASKKFLDELYTTAANTPFEFPELVAASRKFLAFGYSAQETKDILTTVGDTVAGLGGGAEEIGRLTAAFGQIKAKGKVQTEEVLQLAELGVPAFKILEKQLGLTSDALQDQLADGAIKSDAAIRALKAGLDDTFGGSSAAQAKTFTGQMSTLKDNFNQLLGQAAKPLFDFLRDTGLPAMNSLVKDLQAGNIGAKQIASSFGVMAGAAATAFAAFKGASLIRRIFRGGKAASYQEGFAAGAAYKAGFATGSGGAGPGAAPGKGGKKQSGFKRFAGKAGRALGPVAGGAAVLGGAQRYLDSDSVGKRLKGISGGGGLLDLFGGSDARPAPRVPAGAVPTGILGAVVNDAIRVANQRPIQIVVNGRVIGEVNADQQSRAKARR